MSSSDKSSGIPFPERLRQSFGISKATDLLAKAIREFNDFKNCKDMVRSGDHAFNICLSIWHLVDWTHADMTPEERRKAAQHLGMPVNTLTELSIAVQRGCRMNTICRIMATAGKHVEVTNKYADKTIQTIFNVYQRFGPSGESTEFRWAMTFQGDSFEALDVLREALHFWQSLFAAIGWVKSH